MESLGLDGPEHADDPIKIAQITFAFHNSEIINLLTQRGNFIKAEKWAKLHEINKKIEDKIKSQPLLDKLQTPCSVFATFESEEGYSRACVYNEQVSDLILPKSFGKILGDELDLQEASEPTDIIWENRHFLPVTRSMKRLVVYLIVIIMLAMSAAIIYSLSVNSTRLKFKYPVGGCQEIISSFGLPSNPKTASNIDTKMSKWTQAAFDQYEFNE